LDCGIIVLNVIKVLTGNLDQSDAKKYHELINNISKNENKIKTIVEHQTTLLSSSINKFENNSKILEHNQLIFESKLNSIEHQIQNNFITNGHYKIKIENIIPQFMIVYESFKVLLEKVETAVTFSKINILHNSIIDPIMLLHEIQKINNNLKHSRLPFKP